MAQEMATPFFQVLFFRSACPKINLMNSLFCSSVKTRSALYILITTFRVLGLNYIMKGTYIQIRSVLLSLLGLFLCGSQAMELTVGDKDSVCAAATLIIDGMMDYYEGIRYGGTVGMFQPPYYWWIAGEAMGGLIDTWAFCQNDTYQDIIYDALMHQRGSQNNYVPANQSTTEGNDDQAFWGFAVLEAAERNFTNPPEDQPGWLALSQAVYNTMNERWDSATCGGGLRWQIFQWNSGYEYKNTISNAGLFVISARLARYTGNDTYVDTCEKVWDWLDEVKFIVEEPENIHVYDGANIGTDNCSTTHTQEWTYNYAVLLAGSAYLYNHTEDQKWLDRATLVWEGIENTFVNSSTGIVYELCQNTVKGCNNDQRSFKSILGRSLGQAATLLPSLRDNIMNLIDTSAAGAARTCSGGSDGHTCTIDWSANPIVQLYGLGEQMSALEFIQNTIVLQSPPPLTNSTGGTSKGDVNAGLNSHATTNRHVIDVTGKDKAGAGVLTAVVLIIFVAIAAWMII